MTTNADIDKALLSLKPSTSSQDPLDAAADELRIATRIKQHAERRHKQAIAGCTNVIGEDKVQSVRESSISTNTKHERPFHGASFIVLVQCNAPANRVDTTAFFNELVKAGVDRSLLQKCQLAATKQSSPATSFSVVET